MTDMEQEVKKSEEYTTKVYELCGANGTRELVENNPMFHVSEFWIWFGLMCAKARRAGKTEEEVAQLIKESVQKVVDNPDPRLLETNIDHRTYIRLITNKLRDLGLNEFVEKHYILKNRQHEFGQFVAGLCNRAYDMKIPADQAAETIWDELKMGFSEELFLKDFNCDVKH